MYFGSNSFSGIGTVLIAGLVAFGIIFLEIIAAGIFGIIWLFHHVSFH